MTLVAVTTRSKLRGVRFFPAMLLATLRARRQLARTRGIVRWASVIGGPTEFWTLTVWSSVHDLQEFMRSGAHGEVMWKMPRWLSSFWLARWRPGGREIGAWDGLSLVSQHADRGEEPLADAEGADSIRRAVVAGTLTYEQSPLVRRSRARLSGLGGVAVRIDGSPRSLVPALRELRRLERWLRDDPDLIRVFVGGARFREAYLFALWRRVEPAERFLGGGRMRQASERWGDRLWALEWRPENEFGHWDGVRMRSFGDPRFRRSRPGIARIVEPRELFVEALAELLDVEQTLARQVLPELREEVREQHFREAIEQHLEQTREHVERLGRVFGEIGEKPQTRQSAGLEGLRRQRAELVRPIEPSPLRDLANASAAAHVEHYEISSYHGLITLANILGEPDAVRLLEQNLHEEEEALEKLKKAIPERLTGELAPA